MHYARGRCDVHVLMCCSRALFVGQGRICFRDINKETVASMFRLYHHRGSLANTNEHGRQPEENAMDKNGCIQAQIATRAARKRVHFCRPTRTQPWSGLFAGKQTAVIQSVHDVLDYSGDDHLAIASTSRVAKMP